MPQLYKANKDAEPKTFMEVLLAHRDKNPVARKPRAEMSAEDALARWPLLTAHLICQSLGYATPSTAANIINDAANGRENWCEWVYSCFKADPKIPVRMAIAGRHQHTGFMAEIDKAKGLVLADILYGIDRSRLASWF